MKNPQAWKPTKYRFADDAIRANTRSGYVHPGSILNVELVAQEYSRSLPAFARGKLLDLGCGHVPLYAAYRALITESVCVDWSNSEHKNELLDVEHDLNLALPFPDESFDTIVLSDVLEHIYEPRNLCSEMFRIMAVNGQLMLNVPFLYQVHEAPFDYYRYTEFALRRMLEDSGFIVVELRRVGGVVEVLVDQISKVVAAIPVVGEPVARLAQRLTLLWRSTSYGTKVGEKTSTKFPLGYFVVARRP